MPTLDNYITETRRLLHDVNGNFWTTAELTDYINDARGHTVQDSGCRRVLQTYTLTVGVETINFADLDEGSNTIDILNINLYWGDSRWPMYYMAWTDFNAQLRFWQNYNGRPIGFSMYGPKTIYIGPKPDQAYEIELDTVVLPDPLVTGSEEDTQIPSPFFEAVAYYAAHKAKYQEQSYGESEIFKQEYTKQVIGALNSTFTRRIPSPYSSGF
jgi:hypothetical protein